MATGFVQRFKGKIALATGGLWIGGTQVTANANDLNSLAGSGSTVTSYSTDGTISGYGPKNLISSSAANTFTLPAPVRGAEMQLVLTSVSSGAFIKAASGSAFIVNLAGSTGIVMKSTTIMSIVLAGLSTALWGIMSAWSTSTSVIAQPTLSTTT